MYLCLLHDLIFRWSLSLELYLLKICSFLNDGATEAWDSAQEVPYAYQGNKWVGYDNVKSFRIKVKSVLWMF